jgi:hypothetical protein
MNEGKYVPKKKYQGTLTLTNELLTELLTLPEGVVVKGINVTREDFQRETVSIMLEGTHETELTPHVPEGCYAPKVSHEALIHEEVKTVTTVRRVRF